MVKRIDLKFGNRTLATLTARADGKITLEHNLTSDELSIVLTAVPVDPENGILNIAVGNIRAGVDVAFYDATGAEQLALGYDKYGYLDVEDPKRIAGLETALIGPGSTGSQPITVGDLVLHIGPFQKARVFCDRVSRLYDRIDAWLKNTSLTTRRSEFTITEEIFGTYHTFVLEICNIAGKRMATIQPVGASVIGAEGRVEMSGNRDTQALVYFATDGPQINVTVGSGPSPVKISHRVFKDVTSEGWYWLEDVRLGRARQLDEALFRDLVKGVADFYEL